MDNPETRSISLKEVEEKTAKFLKMHLPNGENVPCKWDTWFFEGEIPNQKYRGTYAHLENDNVIYIGVGASRNVGRYTEAGLGSRLHKYHNVDWEKSQNSKIRIYKPTEDYKEITSIATFALPTEYAYLAYSLEAFLIKELCPKRNKIFVTGEEL